MTSGGREAGRETQRKIKNGRATKGDWERNTEVDNERKAQGQKERKDTHAELQKGSE